MHSRLLLAMLFAASAATAAAGATVLSDLNHEHESALHKRSFFADGEKIFLRKRNAHACIMSIVFIVLFPLGAISMHLPLHGVRVTTRIHLPIQILGLVMMIGGMGLGIDIARVDLNFFAKGATIKGHVVIGLLTTSALILFQPAMGLLQHRHFKRTGKKGVFAYIHRWTGRVAICLGWINTGLGFQLVPISLVSTSCLVREYVIMGILGAAWFFLVWWDGYRNHFAKKDKLGAYRLGWNGGIVLTRPQSVGDGSTSDVKLEHSSSPRTSATTDQRHT
ncbi:hypothetical protein H2200_007714 [Cladophialophora chaetospira]|uniref:Cytochrome b561 domain-containing protein n=1 Tax=Cladophialophora chaetospira TaxID=386627 RepID=A0AA38X6Q1_9EURO|nr:hypothetical protein H2200_007714 [Cladophialophora chaetospira]